MDRRPPDPAKILEEWEAWERGDETPGQVMARLKTAGLPDLLRQLVDARAAAGTAPGATPDPVGGPTGGERA